MAQSVNITIPTRADEPKIVALTDWAIATGAMAGHDIYPSDNKKKRGGYYWVAEAHDRTSVETVSAGGGYDEACLAGDHSNCVLPVFNLTESPDASGIFPAHYGSGANQKTYLAIGGRLAYYPQTICAPDLSKTLEHDIIEAGHHDISITCFSAHYPDSHYDDLNDVPRPKRYPAYRYKGALYCRLDEANPQDSDSVFTDGSKCHHRTPYWFHCEPVEVEYGGAPGQIRATELLAAWWFELQQDFENLTLKRGAELNPNKFEIGRFLNKIFLPELAQSAKVMAVNVVPAPRFVGRLQALNQTLKPNMHVKIKCEGRVGIIKTVNSKDEVATVAIDGKHLKYRLEDLTLENS